MQRQINHFQKQFPSILYPSLIFILCFSIITAISCKKEDAKTNDPFVSCCTYDATTYSDGDRRYAIPTLVTNNGDGVNDIFKIFSSAVASNDTIVSFRVFDDSNALIFEFSEVSINSLSYILWEGQITSGPNAGEMYRGAFSYEAIIRGPSGPAVTIVGKACMVLEYCDVREENLFDCVYGTQHTGAGEFDLDLPSGESCY